MQLLEPIPFRIGEMLTNSKVLVTGATGFIGERLVEKLLLTYNVKVRALIRDFSRCSRLARFPVLCRCSGRRQHQVVDPAIRCRTVVFDPQRQWNHNPAEITRLFFGRLSQPGHSTALSSPSLFEVNLWQITRG